jgi:hypothetical protein
MKVRLGVWFLDAWPVEITKNSRTTWLVSDKENNWIYVSKVKKEFMEDQNSFFVVKEFWTWAGFYR